MQFHRQTQIDNYVILKIRSYQILLLTAIYVHMLPLCLAVVSETINNITNHASVAMVYLI